MQSLSRTFRQIVYRLKEVEDMLRAVKLLGAAGELARATRLFGVSSHEDFLDESRLVLVNLLLGERGISSDLMGDVLEVIGLIDEGLIALENESQTNPPA